MLLFNFSWQILFQMDTGGTLYASTGLIQAIMGINEAGIALMITIFALMDSFGTTHNITGDGALSLILSAFVEKKEKAKLKVKTNRTDPTRSESFSA